MYLLLDFGEKVLPKTVRQNQQPMWSDSLMVSFRVYEMTLIVFDAGWEGCRSGLLQWRPHLKALTRSNYELSLNVARA